MDGSNNNRRVVQLLILDPMNWGKWSEYPWEQQVYMTTNLAGHAVTVVGESHTLTGNIKRSLLLPLWEKVFAHSYHKVKLLIVIACGYI